MLSDTAVEEDRNPTIRLLDIEKNESGNCGFHLTRSKWDPYPWVSGVDSGSAADNAGLKSGDCVLEVNGEDIIGQKISEIANLVKKNSNVSLLLWNVGIDPECSAESLCCGPMPRNLQRLIACISSALSFLECPICLDTIPSPCYQCDNGHLICMRCRAKSERCPVCRTRFNRGRSLLADQVYNVITDTFDLKEETEDARNAKMQQIFKLQNKNKSVPGIKVTPAYANKFLTKLVGRATSVDNLSNGKNATSTLSLDGLNANLKAKSLSSTEIFDSSPIISRSNSMRKLNKNSPRASRDFLNVDHRSVSCHGSYESLNSKANDDVPFHTNLRQNFSIHTNLFCPFEQNCTYIIPESKMLPHFQEKHLGPLIQYFKPSIRLNLANILEKQNTYVITHNYHTFFVKILKKFDETTAGLPDIHLWTWCLGGNDVAKSYSMITEILDKDNVPTLNIHSAIYPMNGTTWREISKLRKGIILKRNIFRSGNLDFSDTVLEISIDANQH